MNSKKISIVAAVVVAAIAIMIALVFVLPMNGSMSKSDSEKARMETKGRAYLDSARAALKSKDYEGAKEKIIELRRRCPRAIEARKMGILLMDSIELAEAQTELQKADSIMQADSTRRDNARFEELCEKVKFYHRKLQHDIEKNQTPLIPAQ